MYKMYTVNIEMIKIKRVNCHLNWLDSDSVLELRKAENKVNKVLVTGLQVFAADP